MTLQLNDLDRAIIRATQSGLALTARPFDTVAEQVGASTAEVMARMVAMQDAGIIRRIGAVPNHYALGFTANGMTVWNVDDDRASELGREIGALDFVSHAYLRPRHLPDWPYNLFAMAHGRDKAEVEAKAQLIRHRLGDACQGGEILYSTRILKKTGLRLVA